MEEQDGEAVPGGGEGRGMGKRRGGAGGAAAVNHAGAKLSLPGVDLQSFGDFASDLAALMSRIAPSRRLSTPSSKT